MDAREIEKCIDIFGTDIYRFCLSLCADKTDADDLYQQTFLKALESSINLDWNSNPKALFFSLVHNLWKSDRRKQARRDAIAPSENLDDNYMKKELLSVLNRIVQALPDKFRIPLTLYYLSELTVEQISIVIKKPSGTVKSRLYKGRNMIKKRLEELGYEETV